MVTVGIIANPASGKDIRRLIAHGSVFDNQEKVHIVRRVMLGLQSVGVDQVVFMPDYFGIGRRAVEGVELKLSTSTLEMRMEANQDDSTHAARLMREQGVGAVITLGGDGTNRAVAKEIGDVPIIPISTGTNNVFPQMVESTVAGMAAGLVARRALPLESTTHRQKRLEVYRGDEMIDLALIDVVVYAEAYIGSRAVWDMSKVRELMLTRASPSSIGLSSIGGGLYCAHLNHDHGVHIRLSETEGVLELTAPIAPGLIEPVYIESYHLLEIGAEVPVNVRPSILALDGEREVMVSAQDPISVRLTNRGPLLIDLNKTLELSAQQGLMTRINLPVGEQGGCMLHRLGVCIDPPDSCQITSAVIKG